MTNKRKQRWSKSAYVPIGAGDGWMLTLSDMLLLLLTFFVLLISMSSFDRGVLEKTFGGLFPANSGLLSPGDSVDEKVLPTASQPQEVSSPNLNKLLAPELSRRLDSLQKLMGRAVSEIVVHGQDLRLECPSDYFFGTLDDQLKITGRQALREFAGFLRDWPGVLQVAVFTDNFPLQTEAFPDNQMLAAARLQKLLDAFAELGFNGRRIMGAAWGELRPLTTNDSPENRRRNRRINFILPDWVEKTKV